MVPARPHLALLGHSSILISRYFKVPIHQGVGVHIPKNLENLGLGLQFETNAVSVPVSILRIDKENLDLNLKVETLRKNLGLGFIVETTRKLRLDLEIQTL